MDVVAIPVVVDLLLRPWENGTRIKTIKVAIPVVVDLLLRLLMKANKMKANKCRNPCCSGPTASTVFTIFGIRSEEVAIPVVVDLLLRLEEEESQAEEVSEVAIPVVVDLLLRRFLMVGGASPDALSQSLL